MDVQWIKEFLCLTRTLNYREAAERMHMTTSTLSKHIINIEKELDTQLFVRDTKSVHLTDNGTLFRDCASHMVREYNSAISQLSHGPSISGELHIGAGLRFTKLNEAVHPMLTHFEKKYPEVSIRITDTQYRDYREELIRNTFDVVFSIRLPTMNEEGLEYHDLFELPLCAWITEANRYGENKTVTLEQLADQNMRILEKERCHAYTQWLTDVFAKKGLVPKIGKSMNQAMVIGGDDYGITPNFSPYDHFGFGMRSILIEDGENVTFSMVRKSHISNPIAVLFCEEFKSLFG